MKTNRKIIYILVTITCVFLVSCTKYLDKTEKADVTEKDVFNSFNTYEGYVETLYDDVVELVHTNQGWSEFNNGDDIIPSNYRGWIEGDYNYIISSGRTQYFSSSATRASGVWWETTRNQAIWQNSWFGIRAANTALAHLNELVDATTEQRQLLEGQALFFRGYFHWELMKAWGSIPYVDTVYSADSDMKNPQLGLHVLAEKIAGDLQKAADLLPEDWDLTSTGQRTQGANYTKITKGNALANLAECLLFNGSPLFNGVATGTYEYHTAYCERAAAAAWKVIELANKGVYELVPWDSYKSMFMRKDGTFPANKEIIFSPPYRGDCRYFPSSFTFGHIGTDGFYDAPTQNYVEYFEMANGLPIYDPSSGFNPMDPWAGRDPRFDYNILTDGQRQVISVGDDRKFVQLYVGGRERTSTCSLTGYGWKKYWDETINRWDGGWDNYIYSVPKIRLAEVYLFYAEAVNEAYGPTGKVPGASLTAIDAVNIVRTRSGMPDVNAKFLGSKELFRERIRNERAVELAYENKRWYDLRRWYIATLPKYTELYELKFDKGHTYFDKVLARKIEFREQHYWLPFPANQTRLYPGWKQNPGW